MKKLIPVLIIAAFISGNVYGQKLKVVTATKQNWSGGVVGHYGCNYVITIGPVSPHVVLDSIYINNQGYKLNLYNQPGGNVAVDTAQHSYSIHIGESHFTENSPFKNEDKSKSAKPSPVRHFKGAALVLYKYKKKKCELIITELTQLRTLNYP